MEGLTLTQRDGTTTERDYKYDISLGLPRLWTRDGNEHEILAKRQIAHDSHLSQVHSHTCTRRFAHQPEVVTLASVPKHPLTMTSVT